MGRGRGGYTPALVLAVADSDIHDLQYTAAFLQRTSFHWSDRKKKGGGGEQEQEKKSIKACDFFF